MLNFRLLLQDRDRDRADLDDLLLDILRGYALERVRDAVGEIDVDREFWDSISNSACTGLVLEPQQLISAIC